MDAGTLAKLLLALGATSKQSCPVVHGSQPDQAAPREENHRISAVGKETQPDGQAAAAMHGADSGPVPESAGEAADREANFNRPCYMRFRRRLQRSDCPEAIKKSVSVGGIRQAYQIWVEKGENLDAVAETLLKRSRETTRHNDKNFDWVTKDQLRDVLKCTSAEVEQVWRERLLQGAVRKHPQAAI